MRRFKLTKAFLNNPRGTQFELKYWEGRGSYFHITDPLSSNRIHYWVSKGGYPNYELEIPKLFKEIK